MIAAEDENAAVTALLRYAERHPRGEQRSIPDPLAEVDIDSEDLVGMIVAAEHGVDPSRLPAYKALARSRGISLEQCLRALFRGELAEVVRLEAVRRLSPYDCEGRPIPA